MDSKPDKAKVIVRFSPDVILCGWLGLNTDSLTKVTVTFLKEQNIQILASCDFWSLHLIKEKLAGWKFSHIHDSELCNSSKFRAPCTFSIKLSNCLWILVQMTETVFVKRRRVLWRNVNVVDKSNHYFLFYWPADITKWTALICTCRIYASFHCDLSQYLVLYMWGIQEHIWTWSTALSPREDVGSWLWTAARQQCFFLWHGAVSFKGVFLLTVWF